MHPKFFSEYSDKKLDLYNLLKINCWSYLFFNFYSMHVSPILRKYTFGIYKINTFKKKKVGIYRF